MLTVGQNKEAGDYALYRVFLRVIRRKRRIIRRMLEDAHGWVESKWMVSYLGGRSRAMKGHGRGILHVTNRMYDR